MNESLVLFKRVIHWLLLIVTFVYLLSGLGITQYQIMESITFGLLSKSLSFNIHNNLITPFVVLLILHVIVSMVNHGTKQK
jgi:cytochrome b subunit of formate dehydrogenase